MIMNQNFAKMTFNIYKIVSINEFKLSQKPAQTL